MAAVGFIRPPLFYKASRLAFVSSAPPAAGSPIHRKALVKLPPLTMIDPKVGAHLMLLASPGLMPLN